MKTFCLLLVIAFVTSGSFGLNLRPKRQSDDKEEGLEDRYGWNQGRIPQGQGFNPFLWQNSISGQNQFPGQGQFQFPGQGQFQFPGQGQNQFPSQGQQPTTQQPTTQQPSTGTTTISPALQNCIARCPVTPEFRPVCGSNRVQYTNPGKLICAKMCGVEVSLWREAPCPSDTTPSPV